MGFLTGGGGSSESKNKAYGWVKDEFGDVASGAYGGATNVLGDILGLNGSGASKAALDDYWNSSGGQFLLNQGTDSINSNFAARGLAKSGAAMKGLEQYRLGLASTKLDNYLGHLGNLGQLGLGGGNLVAQAGQVSKGAGGQGGGIGGLIGSGLAAYASNPAAFAFLSDPRAKENIIPTGRYIGGVPEIAFDYRQDTGFMLPEGRFIGVSAKDVERLRPDALGPMWNGYLTVDYAKLGGGQ